MRVNHGQTQEIKRTVGQELLLDRRYRRNPGTGGRRRQRYDHRPDDRARGDGHRRDASHPGRVPEQDGQSQSQHHHGPGQTWGLARVPAHASVDPPAAWRAVLRRAEPSGMAPLHLLPAGTICSRILRRGADPTALQHGARGCLASAEEAGVQAPGHTLSRAEGRFTRGDRHRLHLDPELLAPDHRENRRSADRHLRLLQARQATIRTGVQT